MSDPDPLLTSLRNVLPDLQMTTEDKVLQNSAVDEILPRMIVTPKSVAEVSQIIALAHKHKSTVLPRGSGSHLPLGQIPTQIDIVLETQHLNHLLEHEGPDLTCHTEAGIPLAQLQTALKKSGQWLALDPPSHPGMTIGGLLATNASGPKRLRYGTARDLVIGLKVVQANGEIARSGGNVVKNVAGYDLNKLYIGSLATLGIIVEANFKLHPLPPDEQTVLFTYKRASDAMQTVNALIRSALIPSAIELLDDHAAIAIAHLSGLYLPTIGYLLAVNFEGSLPAIERQIHETRLLAHGYHALSGDTLQGDDQSIFWDSIGRQTQGRLVCKVSLLLSEVAQYLMYLKEICQRYALEAATVAHAGSGILYIELQPTEAISRLVKAILELRIRAKETRGSLIIERCPTLLKHSINVWGEPGADFPLMQALKQQFDPQGTFVSGRFLGGL